MNYFIYSILVFVISIFIGSKRKIGFFWSFFFCIFLSPIIGFIVSYYSPKNGQTISPKDKVGNKILLFISIPFLLVSLFLILKIIMTPSNDESYRKIIFICISFVGTTIYLFTHLNKNTNNKYEVE